MSTSELVKYEADDLIDDFKGMVEKVLERDRDGMNRFELADEMEELVETELLYRDNGISRDDNYEIESVTERTYEALNEICEEYKKGERKDLWKHADLELGQVDYSIV